MNNKTEIARFEDHFANQIRFISNINKDQYPVYPKVLYATLIDALSLVFLEGNQRKGPIKHQSRYTNILSKLTYKWPHLNSVSLPQLSLKLGNVNSPLNNMIKKTLDTWHLNSTTEPWDQDGDLKKLLALVDDDSEKKNVEICQHKVLFYKYRCNLVHEFRLIGNVEKYDEKNKKVPCYFPDHKSTPPKWDLIYPTQFFNAICTEALAIVSTMLRDQDVLPWKAFNQGPLWDVKINT